MSRCAKNVSSSMQHNDNVFYTNVETAFQNSELDKEIYMEE